MIWAVVPAGGSGRRLPADRPKQYLPLAGRPILWRTLDALAACPEVEGIVLVLAREDLHWTPAASWAGKPLLRAEGGAERAHSVRAGLAALPATVQPHELVLVHDAARPLLHSLDVARLCTALADAAAGGLLAAPLRDTLKHAAAGKPEVLRTEARERYWRALTPQCFRRGILEHALDAALAAARLPTDEAQAVEWLGHPVQLVEGREDNLKITTAVDLKLAEALWAMREEESRA